MRTLSTPNIEAQSLYQRISRARKSSSIRARLAQAEGLVLQAYAAYDGSAATVCGLQPIITQPATEADLRGNYTYLTQSAKDIRAEILRGSPDGRCPLCDQGRVATLDHYLPQTTFPEFAILPVNLIPACAECNRTKAAAYEEAGEGLFLHAYLDVLPSKTRFLFARTGVDEGAFAVSFHVEPPRSLAADLRRRIRSHFARLGLADYYRAEGVNELTERGGSIKELVDGGASVGDVGGYLRREADSVAKARGCNYWRYALLDAAAASAEICAGKFDLFATD
jgi:hypothetical protein